MPVVLPSLPVKRKAKSMIPTDDDLVLMIHLLQRAVMERYNSAAHPQMVYDIQDDYFVLNMELDLSSGEVDGGY